MKPQALMRVMVCSIITMSSIAAQTNKPTIFPDEDPLTLETLKLVWPTTPGLRYEVRQSTTLQSWFTVLGYPAAANGPAQQLPFRTESAALFFQVRELDEQPPAIVNQYPQDGGFAVPRFGNLAIQLSDATDIDTNSIRLTVSSLGTFTLTNAQLSFSNGSLTFINDGSAPLGGWGSNITATLVAGDTLGNRSTNTWSFTLELQPQVVTNLFVFGSPQAQFVGQRIGNFPTAALANRFGPVPKAGDGWALEMVGSNQIVLAYTNTAPAFSNNTYVCNLTPTTTDEIFYRKITSVSNNPVAKRLTLFTTDVPLPEILQTGSASLSSQSVIYDVDSNNVIIRATSFAGTLQLPVLGADKSGTTVYSQNGVTLSLEEAKWLFTPTLSFAFETTWLSLQRFDARFHGALQTALVPELTFTGLDLSGNRTFDLVVPKRQIIFIETPVPVWLELKFSLGAEIGYNLSATASMSAGVRQDVDLTFDVDYAKNRSPNLAWNPSVTPYPLQIVPLTYQINGSASAYATIRPQIDVLVYGLAGVYANVDPTVEISGQATVSNGQLTSADWGIMADANLNIGLSIIGVDSAPLPALPPFNLFRWEWSSAYPSPGQLTIRTQPQNQQAVVGSAASFSVNALSAQPISYQWYFNAIPLPGQTGSILQLNNVTYGHAGPYFVRVRSGGQTLQSSNAMLVVNALETPPPPGTLVSGLTVRSSITAVGEVDRYTVTLTAGEPYTLVATDTGGGSFSPYISLYRPDGTLVASDSAPSVAVISGTAPVSGTYYLFIRDSAYFYTGGYSVTLTKVLGPQAPDPSGDDGELTSGATRLGTNSPLGDIDRYTVTLTAGEPYTLVATDTGGGSFSPYISLYRPDGTLVASDSAPSVAVISGTAPVSGTYYLFIRDSAYFYTGGYSVTLTKVLGPQAPDPSGDDGEVTSGATRLGTNSPLGDIDRYTVTLTAGEPYTLVATDTGGGSFSPYISLYRPDGTLVASDSAPSVAVISGTAPVSGTYYLFIRDSAYFYTGGYSVTLTKVLGPQAPDPSGDDGEVTSGATRLGTNSPLGDIDRYTVTLTAGEPYTLVATDTGGGSFS